jgi:thioredoxin 2
MSAETPLLAFFTEPRSGPARRMESLLAHLARKERGRLRVTRVDIEEKPDVAERLNVETVPTLLLIKGKRVVGRLEGRVSAPRIERMLDQHLEPAEVAAA